ncbi:unnamed protein product [Prunus brigantina]
MDASVLRAVVLMSMLVLSIAQADINPSYTNAVPNDNPLDQVDDVYPRSNTNQVVPNGHIISCGLKCATKCLMNPICLGMCMIRCKHRPSDVVYDCTHNCANSIATTSTSNSDKRYVEVSASDDVFTWDDVVKISKQVHISGATRKRSKSEIALSLESHSEFLPFVIEVHSQIPVRIQIPVSCSDIALNNFPKSLVLLRIYVVSRTCLLSHQKIQTLMAVAFIAEHRTRAVGDVIKSLGEEHSPASHVGYILICMMNGNWLIGLIGAIYVSSSASTWRVRNFSGSIESGRFINGLHMNGYVEKDGKKFLWISKRSQ